VSDEQDNVIHLSFRRDGTVERIRPPKSPPSEPEPSAEEEARARGERRDPLADLYSRREVARLFGLTEGRLRYWERTGFLEPSAGEGARRQYTFQDLIGVRAAKGLLDRGVPLKEVRRSVEALRSTLPKCVRPLTELRVTADGQTMLVQDEAGVYEPRTGQRVLDFRVDTLKEDVVRVLRGKPRPEDQATAYELYLEGCRLDEDEATYDRAEEAYEKAVALDPSLSNALTNLGNLCYRRGQVERAQRYYERALKVDADQPEAYYNLGFLHLERAEPAAAAERFREAIDRDPGFADAHFNLAMAYEEMGEHPSARAHWETYLALEPKGPWADIAKRHLRGQA
jgi:tetratricopeptide (TPR) repeat protein